jgi:hypothetical protein
MSDEKKVHSPFFENIGPDAPPDANAKHGWMGFFRNKLKEASDFLNRDDVETVREVATDIFEVASSIDPKKPLTYALGAVQLVNVAASYLEDTGVQTPFDIEWYTIVNRSHPLISGDLALFFFEDLDSLGFKTLMLSHSKSKSKAVKAKDADQSKNNSNVSYAIYCYEFSPDVKIYFKGSTAYKSMPKTDGARFDYTIYIDNGIPPVGYDSRDPLQKKRWDEAAQRVFSVLAKKVWTRYSNHIEICWDDMKGSVIFKNREEPPWGYKGDRGTKLIDQWGKFLQAGIRRAVVLHGPPGNGKSTLAREAAKRLGRKTLYIPLDTLDKSPSWYLESVLGILSPEIVIVDDLDRLGTGKLSKLLALFEENVSLLSKVPLVIATTNDITRLPSALRRPGRFDEVWSVTAPDHEMLGDLIYHLAQEEKCSLGEGAYERIFEMASNLSLSGAHIRELLRRVKVLGITALDISSEDLTFSGDFFLDDEEIGSEDDCNDDEEELMEGDDDEEELMEGDDDESDPTSDRHLYAAARSRTRDRKGAYNLKPREF